ncbi:MAG: PA2169 family four-helix-bundle protein [Rhodospirillaceae bacterium]
MITINEQQIKIINGLIEATVDSADGYHEAAKDARNPVFKTMFETRSTRRKQLATGLQAEVRALGGKPADDGTILAATHRIFLNLKNLVTGDDESVIAEIEAGEDYIKAKFERALQEEGLVGSVHAVVAKAYQSVKADHDQMSALKHGLERHAA